MYSHSNNEIYNLTTVIATLARFKLRNFQCQDATVMYMRLCDIATRDNCSFQTTNYAIAITQHVSAGYMYVVCMYTYKIEE